MSVESNKIYKIKSPNCRKEIEASKDSIYKIGYMDYGMINL